LTGRNGRVIFGADTLRGYGMRDQRPKKEVLLRLKRIEGQLRGLQRMVEQDVACIDILTQVAAVTSAMKRVGMLVVQTYMDECLNASDKDSPSFRAERLKELHRAISQYMDWA